MVRVLGLIDLFATSILVAIAFSIDIPRGLIIVIVVLLLCKAIPFIKDIGSFFDIIAAIVLVLTFFINLPVLILYIAAGLLGLKGLTSLFTISG